MSITMKDIANHLNISRTTVSYVLNGHGEERKIPLSTVRKVTKTAQDLGYTLNLAAQSVSSNQSRIIGLLISGEYKAGFILEMISEFCRMATLNNYIPSMISYSSMENYKQAIQKCLEQRMCGIMALEPNGEESQYLLNTMKKSDIKTVIVHSRPENIKEGSFIYSDDYMGGKMMAEYIISLGHKKIAYVNSLENHHNRSLRLKGFLDAMNEANLSIDDKYMWTVLSEDMILDSKGSQMLANPDSRPSAVCCFADTAALEILQQAHRLKINVPEELSVTGFGDLEFGKKLPVPLTTVRQNFVTIANTAFKLLYNQLEKKSGDNENITFNVPVELIVRESTTNNYKNSKKEDSF